MVSVLDIAVHMAWIRIPTVAIFFYNVLFFRFFFENQGKGQGYFGKSEGRGRQREGQKGKAKYT